MEKLIFCDKLQKFLNSRISTNYRKVLMLFSIFYMLVPLIGLFLGTMGIVGVFFFSKILLGFSLGLIPLTTTGLPTLAAALVWRLSDSRKNNLRIKLARFAFGVLIPVTSILLFVFHPSVGYGWWYSLYWLIPVGLYTVQMLGWSKSSVFATAISSTFIAHAVGSLIWCYLIPMSPDQWLALIPVVAVERFVFAVGMTAFYHASILASSLFSSILVLSLKKSVG